MTETYTALLLAGDRSRDDPLLTHEAVSTKALIRVGTTTLIENALGVLQACPLINEIIVVGDDVLKNYLPKGVRFVSQSDGPSASVINVLDDLADKKASVFITTVDHRLLRSSDISEFLDKSKSFNSDLSLATVRMNVVQEKFPDGQRTSLMFKDGAFSGCNMFMVRPDVCRELLVFWKSAEKHRKKPLVIARKIGLWTVLLMGLRRLTFDQMLMRLGCKFGLSIQRVSMQRAELAVDIDKIEDLELVRRVVDKEIQTTKEAA